jgi:hypothetical protein
MKKLNQLLVILACTAAPCLLRAQGISVQANAYLIAGAGSNIINYKNLTTTGSFTNNASTVILKGNMVNNGTISGASVITLNGTAAQTLSGTGTLGGITLNNSLGLTLTSGTQTQNGALTLNTGTLTLTGTLNIHGNVVNNTTITGTALLNGSTAQTITGLGVMQSLTVNNSAGATITSGTGTMVNIKGLLSVPAGTLTTNGNLTLKSSAAATASVGTVVTGGISGNVIAERYVSNKRSWKLLASPVNSTQTIKQSLMENGASIPGYGTFITGTTGAAGGFDVNYANNPSMYLYVPGATNVTPVTSTAATLSGQQGSFIFIRGDRSININDNTAHNSTVLRVTGTVKIGTQPAVSVPATGYTLVGNPYPAPIDFTKITKSTVKNNFYVWDYSLGGTNGVGAYVLLSTTDGINYTTTPSSSMSTIIQSGEAFLVASSSATSAGTVTIDESAKSTASSTLSVFSSSVPTSVSTGGVSQLKVNLLATDANNSVLDGVLVNYSSQYSNAVDNDDAVKFENAGENMALVRNGNSLILESRTGSHNDTLYLNFFKMQPAPYNLQIDPTAFKLTGKKAFLVDAYLHTSTPVNLGNTQTYTFTVTGDQASYNNRFTIIMDQTEPAINFVAATAQLETNKAKIAWLIADESQVKQYEVQKMTGSGFNTLGSLPVANKGTYVLYDSNLQAGLNYYRIKATDVYGNETYSNTIDVNAVSSNPSVIYPNPAINNQVVVHFNPTMPMGNYNLKLVDAYGKIIKTATVTYNGGELSKTLITDGHNGVYVVELTAGSYQHIEKVLAN